MSTLLQNISSSIGVIIPNIWEQKKNMYKTLPNHQPAITSHSIRSLPPFFTRSRRFKGASSWKASSVVAKVTDQAAICSKDQEGGLGASSKASVRA